MERERQVIKLIPPRERLRFNNCRDIYIQNSHVTVRHVEIAGPDRTTALSMRGLSVVGPGSGVYISDATVSHCWIHNTYKGCLGAAYADNVVVEYNKIGPNGNYDANDGVHGYGFDIRDVNTMAVRYNLFEDISETGYMSLVNDAAGEVAKDWSIHGNIFFESREISGTKNFQTFSFASSNTVVSNLRFYHNTIANRYVEGGGNAGFHCVMTDGGGNVVKNNIWYNNRTNACLIPDGWTHDYNYFCDNSWSALTEANRQVGTGDLFNDMANRDFSLLSPTDAGDAHIGDTYNIDMFGTIRGADGTWDRGAVEFVSEGALLPICDLQLPIAQPRIPNPWTPEPGYDIADMAGNRVNWKEADSGIYLVRKKGMAEWTRVTILE